VKLLMQDDPGKSGRITQDVIDSGRQRFLQLTSMAGSRALREIDKIAELLGLL
jgi:hypothetical protein